MQRGRNLILHRRGHNDVPSDLSGWLLKSPRNSFACVSSLYECAPRAAIYTIERRHPHARGSAAISALIQSLRLAHRAFQVKHLHVLPILFEKRDQEIDSKLGVLKDVLLIHATMSDGHVQAKNFLELKLDRSFDFVNLGGELLLLLHKSGELACLVQAWTKKTWNLLDQTLRRDERMVLFCCASKFANDK